MFLHTLRNYRRPGKAVAERLQMVVQEVAIDVVTGLCERHMETPKQFMASVQVLKASC